MPMMMPSEAENRARTDETPVLALVSVIRWSSSSRRLSSVGRAPACAVRNC